MATKKNSDQKEALSKALNAVVARDRLGILQGILDSMLLEAYKGYFKKKYPDIQDDDILDIIGSSTDDLVEQAMKGSQIRSIENYLWKIIDRKLIAFSKKNEVTSKGATVESIGARQSMIGDDIAQEEKEERREHVISIAENLIPRLGLVNVQNVMRYVLGSIRNGAEDITSNEIGEALNISPGNVRLAMKRGFERLQKIVHEEKLVDESYSLTFLSEQEYYFDEEDDNEDDNDLN